MKRVDVLELPGFDRRGARRTGNLEKHGIGCPDAALALLRPHAEASSERTGEERVEALRASDGWVLVVIVALRDSICNIMSARPARQDERRAYREILGG